MPAPLAGTSNSNTAKYPLPALKKFDDWDRQDGQTGIRNTVTKAVDMKAQGALKMMKAELTEHYRALNVFSEMTRDAQYQWRMISQRITNSRNICLAQNDDEDEAFLYPCGVIRGMLNECHKLRNVGAGVRLFGPLKIQPSTWN